MRSAHPLFAARGRLSKPLRTLLEAVLLTVSTGCSTVPVHVETAPRPQAEAREARSSRRSLQQEPLSCEQTSPDWLSACGSGRSEADAQQDALRALSLRLQASVQTRLEQVTREDRQGLESAFQELTTRELTVTSGFIQEGGLRLRVQEVPEGYRAEARLDRLAALRTLHARSYLPQAETFRRLADETKRHADNALQFTPLWREARALGEALVPSARQLELLMAPEALALRPDVASDVPSSPAWDGVEQASGLAEQGRILRTLQADAERLRTLETQARAFRDKSVFVWGAYSADQTLAAELRRWGIPAVTGEGIGLGIRLDAKEAVQQSGQQDAPFWECTLTLTPQRVVPGQNAVPLHVPTSASGRSSSSREAACTQAMLRGITAKGWSDALATSFCEGFPCEKGGLPK